MEDGTEKAEIPEESLKAAEESPDVAETVAEENVSGLMPEVEHAHGPHGHESGIRWLDVIVTVSVVFISVISLVVSIEHGKSMEKMVDQNQKLVVASTLPLLTVDTGTIEPVTNKPLARLILQNNGVGPAIIQRFEIRYKGVAQTHETIMRACCAQVRGKSRLPMVYFDVSGTIMSARESRDLITVRPIGSDHRLLQAYEAAWNDMSYHACYCSVLDECWETDFDPSKRPQPVKECKVAPGEKLW
jgi:hypothetical protein